MLRHSNAVGHDFYPRPPRGGRQEAHNERKADDYFYPRPPRGERRRARERKSRMIIISIHALREEGDSKLADKIGIIIS